MSFYKYNLHIYLLFLFGLNLGASIKFIITILLFFIFGNFRKLKFDFSFLVLFSFSIIFLLFVFFSDLDLFFEYLFGLLLVLITYCIAMNFNLDNIRKLNILYFSSFAITITPVLSILSDLIQYGFLGSGSRSIPYFYSNDLPISATVMAGFLIPGGLLISLSLKKINFFMIIYSVILFWCSVRLGSRTLISFYFLAFLMGVFCYFRISFYYLCLGISIFFIFLFLSYNYSDYILNYFSDRLDSSENLGLSSAGGRLDRWYNSFISMFSEPFGWDLGLYGYAHNMFLDVARSSGIFPAFILFYWYLLSFYYFLKNIVNNKKEVSLVLSLTVIGFGLVAFLEPIFDGFIYLFIFYVFTFGLYRFR